MLPSQAKDLIADGIIREGFLWNPTEAGYAMVAVGSLVLDGKEIKDGMDIPGLGKASVDVPGKLIKVDKSCALTMRRSALSSLAGCKVH